MNIRNYIYILLLACPIVLTYAQQKDSIKNTQLYQKYITDGNESYQNDKLNAEKNYRLANSKDKNRVEALYNLGNVLYENQLTDESIPQYQKALKSAKTKEAKAQIYHNLGNSYMSKKEYAKAMNAFKNSLINNPSDEKTRYNYVLAKKLIPKNKNNKNNKDKNKDKNNNDKNKDNKDKDKKDNKKDDKKDNKDKDNKDKDDKNKDKKDDKKDKDNKDKDKQDKNKDDKKDKKKKGGMSPQQIQNLLNGIDNEDNRVQKKMGKQRKKGIPLKQEKDW